MFLMWWMGIWPWHNMWERRAVTGDYLIMDNLRSIQTIAAFNQYAKSDLNYNFEVIDAFISSPHTVDYAPTSVTKTTGGTVTGTVANAQVMFDGTEYEVAEVTGVPGFDIRFGFTGIADIPSLVVARYQYDGSATHFVGLQLYNYATTAWDDIRTFSDSAAFHSSLTAYIPEDIKANYVDASGNAQVRFYHHTTGNASHDMHIDYVGLVVLR